MSIHRLSISLPENVLKILDKVQKDRNDPSRSDTVRSLLVKALAEMSYMPKNTKKSFGVIDE